jgi:hypothetical protein
MLQLPRRPVHGSLFQYLSILIRSSISRLINGTEFCKSSEKRTDTVDKIRAETCPRHYSDMIISLETCDAVLVYEPAHISKQLMSDHYALLSKLTETWAQNLYLLSDCNGIASARKVTAYTSFTMLLEWLWSRTRHWALAGQNVFRIRGDPSGEDSLYDLYYDGGIQPFLISCSRT